MPVELSPTSVERALALLGEHDLEAPRDVEGPTPSGRELLRLALRSRAIG